jgi:cytochrome c oxidase cbb3-type subunit III
MLMRISITTAAAVTVLLGITLANPSPISAQDPPPAQNGRGGAVRRGAGGFVPGQKRPPGDPVEIARGKTIYGISCTGCHGADLRGGDLGGPNLLRSQTALADQEGERIIPIIEGSRQANGMPAIPMSRTDAKAVSAYVRSILETIGRQGMPPSVGQVAPSVLVGNAAAGQVYFAAKCGACHSATGDLKGIATRIADPKALQNAWVSGGGGGRRGGGGGNASSARTVTATVTSDAGEKTEGRLVHIDDFLVTLALPDGTLRSFRRIGESPKIEVNDPMKGHRDLLPIYTDKDMHDVTAFLVTLK